MLLDSSIYDLDTSEGQLQAIQDMIDEQNRQFDLGSSLKSLQVAFFDTKKITLNTPPYTGDPIPIVEHGLNYEPIFIAYFGSLTAAGIFSTPLINFIGAIGLNGTANFYVDEQNLYVKWDSSAPTPIQQVTYIIFSNPISS